MNTRQADQAKAKLAAIEASHLAPTGSGRGALEYHHTQDTLSMSSGWTELASAREKRAGVYS